jgi:hypothetical protein
LVFVKIVAVTLSLIALLTGAMDVIVGVAGQANIGVGPAASPPFDPVLDSQIRFLGAVWLGFGAIQLIALLDLQRYGTILQLCFGITVLGGLGRALSLAKVGLPASDTGLVFVAVALAIELVLVPSAWFAFRKALAKVDDGVYR